jgi:hypothetical protein
LDGFYFLKYMAKDRSGNISFSESRAIQVWPAYYPGCVSGVEPGLSLDNYFVIFPNPGSGIFTIQSYLPDTKNKARIFVTDLLGKQVYKTENDIFSKSMQLDFSGMSPGIYFLKINFEGRELIRKIEITR